MKKKQRCLFNRFAALVAVLCLSCSLMLPFASAASSTESAMASLDAFHEHQGSWFVWRRLTVSGIDCVELLCSPISISGSSYTLLDSISYSTDAFDVNYLASDSGKSYSYACAFPYPLRGASGLWSELPPFPVGSALSHETAVVRVYSTSAQSSNTYGFLTSSFSSSDRLLSFGNTSGSSSGSSTDTFDSFTFSSPFYSYPFAIRESSTSSASGYVLQGGASSFFVPPDDYSSTRNLNLNSTCYLLGTHSFIPYPSGHTISSSDIGFVFVKRPSSSPVYSASAFNTTGSFVFSLLVPAPLLSSDLQLGDWYSRGAMDAFQDQLVNDFGISSDTFSSTKDSVSSWTSTDSIDSDVASSATGLLNGIFQNLGTFLFSVSLLCFGAVVLRILLRKGIN